MTKFFNPRSLVVLWTFTCFIGLSPLLAIDTTWLGSSTGNWEDAGNWSSGVPQNTGDTAIIPSAATITLTSAITLKQLKIEAPVTLTLGSGGSIFFSNAGGDTLVTTANLLIKGSGHISFSRAGTSDADFANIKPNGNTITIDAQIIDNVSAGLELQSTGTLRLTNPNNTFVGYVRIYNDINVEFTTPGALGTRAILFDNNNARCTYVGNSDATLNIPLEAKSAQGLFCNQSGHTLTLNAGIQPNNSGNKTVTLETAGGSQTIVASDISEIDGSTLNLVITGSGNTIFNQALAYTGTTHIEGRCLIQGSPASAQGAYTLLPGGLLSIENALDFRAPSLTCETGAKLYLNALTNDNYDLTLPASTIISGHNIQFIVPAADTSSTITIPSLVQDDTMDSLILTAPEIGTERNRIFLNNIATGPLPDWLAVNSKAAAYDATEGIFLLETTNQYITALGPAVIADGDDNEVIINASGTSGGITLEKDPTTIFALTQAHADHPATVELNQQALQTFSLNITESGNDLTLQNGLVTVPHTPLTFNATTLPSLTTAPVAWFDLADSTTVTTNAQGRIVKLANKGSTGKTLDAAPAEDRIAPLYGVTAHNNLGVAIADDVNPPQGLKTLNHLNISSNDARTVFVVAARSPVSANSFYPLFLGVDNQNNKAFGVTIRPTSVDFITFDNDIVIPTLQKNHHLYTFITGLDEPDDGAAYINGELVGTKTFAMLTENAPIHLLHRPNVGHTHSGPGEMAEVLIYDYTLDETERTAVEAYLMHKWHLTATSLNGQLNLINDNAAAILTAPVGAEPPGVNLSLAHFGAGPVFLQGPLTFSGGLMIDQGTFTLDIPAEHTTYVHEAITGNGHLKKEGAGVLVLTQFAPYSGGTTIAAGTLHSTTPGALGSGPVKILTSGALDIKHGTPYTATTFINNPITVAGDGPDGLGALRNSAQESHQQQAFKDVTLNDDTTVYARSRMDVSGGSFDFGGYALSIQGGNIFGLIQSSVTGIVANTTIHIEDGALQIQEIDLAGSDANQITTAADAGTHLYNQNNPIAWSLNLAQNAFLSAAGATATNLNQWAGPITLSGDARLITNTGASLNILEPLTGGGGLITEGDGWIWLPKAPNTYAGTTTLRGSTLYAPTPGALGQQGTAGLTVTNNGALYVPVDVNGNDYWRSEELAAIVNTNTFVTPGHTSLTIETMTGDLTLDNDLPHMHLAKLGAGKLTLTGEAPALSSITLYNGELDLSDTAEHHLGTGSVVVGRSFGTATTPRAHLYLANTTLEATDPGYNIQAPQLLVADSDNSRGVVEIGENTLINANLMVAQGSGSVGAIYQTSGVVTNISGQNSPTYIASYGSGYYRLDDGHLAFKGTLRLAHHSGSTGTFEQRGGSVVLNPGSAGSTGEITDYYNGSFGTGGGVSLYHITGGTFDVGDHTFNIGEWTDGGNYNDGYAMLNIENDAHVSTTYQVYLANRNANAKGCITLRGGTLSAPYILKGNDNGSENNARGYINLDGGYWQINGTGNGLRQIIRTGSNNTPIELYMHEGGATFEVTELTGAAGLDQPLIPAGPYGITDISITNPGSDYLIPPVLLFSGQDSASVIADIDRERGTLSSLRMISPGSMKTSSKPSIHFRHNGGTGGSAEIQVGRISPTGGLTKSGPGLLSLMAANSYTGPTIVEAGILQLNAGTGTLSPASPIILQGGVLDLGGATIITRSPVTITEGQVINGTLLAPNMVKEGSNTVVLAATPRLGGYPTIHEEYITGLKPMLWYDPSDLETVTLNELGRITRLANKGTRENMDAISTLTIGNQDLEPPQLATEDLTWAASNLPMIRIFANKWGLGSENLMGMEATAVRTVVVVCARESNNNGAVVGYGAGGTDGANFEIGDRHSEVVVGCNGPSYDLKMPLNPAQQPNIIFGMVSDKRTTEAWRTGVDPLYATRTLGGDIKTVDTHFMLGQRGNNINNSQFRGQIGEVLFFDRLLSDAERMNLQHLLTEKWLKAEQVPPAAPTVKINDGTVRLAPNATTVAAMQPTVWYDPSASDLREVAPDGRVIKLINKGTRGAAMNAILPVRNGNQYRGPLLQEDQDSYATSGKAMLRIDANDVGLESLNATDIIDDAPRTIVAVLARNDGGSQDAVVGFGHGAGRQNIELGDRSNGAAFGIFQNDLSISPVLAAQKAQVFTMMAEGYEVAGWRSGGSPKYVTKTLGAPLITVNTPLCLGFRHNIHRDTFRGQIGEVLLFDRLLTASEQADLENYLALKWTQAPATSDQPFAETTFEVMPEGTLDLAGGSFATTIIGNGTISNGVLAAGTIISPAGDDAIGVQTLHNVSFAESATYRITLDSLTKQSDCIFVDGDLSNLTLMPTADPQTLRGTFRIASGQITGKPSLGEFPAHFKLYQRGNDLLLSTTSGAVLLLR